MSHSEIEQLLRERPAGWWQELESAIPELVPLSGTPQPQRYHAEGDVAVHTRLVIEACPADAHPDLLWAALLHDIGKPETTRIQDGRVTAHNHARVGADMAGEILKQLKLPQARIDRIAWAIHYHTFHHSWQLDSAEQATTHQKRFVAHEDFPFLLELLRIDSAASHGHPDGMSAYELYRSLRDDIDRA